MGRFDYLKPDKTAKKKSKKKSKKDAGHELENLAVVYVRRETIRAVWSELKKESEDIESLSELVDDLLLEWLNERQR